MSERRSSDREDETYFHLRQNERTKVARIGNAIEPWFKLAWPFLALMGSAFVATVWNPIRSIPTLTYEVQTLVEQHKHFIVIDSITNIREEKLERGQAVMGKILCFNLDETDRAKYDIDCSSIPLPEKR